MNTTEIVTLKRLTYTEAARRLGIPVKSIAGLVQQGALRGVNLPGRRPSVLEASIEDLIRRIHDGDDLVA